MTVAEKISHRQQEAWDQRVSGACHMELHIHCAGRRRDERDCCMPCRCVCHTHADDKSANYQGIQAVMTAE